MVEYSFQRIIKVLVSVNVLVTMSSFTDARCYYIELSVIMSLSCDFRSYDSLSSFYIPSFLFRLFLFRLFLYPFLLRLLLIHRKEQCTKAPTGAIRTKLSKAHSFDRFKRDSAAGATKFRTLNFYFILISISMCIFIATAFSFLSSSS